jgi:hypothetical protein
MRRRLLLVLSTCKWRPAARLDVRYPGFRSDVGRRPALTTEGRGVRGSYCVHASATPRWATIADGRPLFCSRRMRLCRAPSRGFIGHNEGPGGDPVACRVTEATGSPRISCGVSPSKWPAKDLGCACGLCGAARKMRLAVKPHGVEPRALHR